MPPIVKSSRHDAIIGDFGENLICNWLSRSGFEVTIVDHTGIDIVGYNRVTKQRIGISVKSRARDPGYESESVHLFSYQKKDDRQKVLDACTAFQCEPWIAVYVERTDSADAYLTSLSNYDKKYRGKKDRAIDDWKMKEEPMIQYENDPDVKHIHFNFLTHNWWKLKS
jgi:hypothetical protein